MEKLAWLVPALPLVAWAVLLLVGKRLPGGGAGVGILAVAVGWVISLTILFGVVGGAGAQHELDAQALLIGDGDEPGEPLFGLSGNRLVDFRQPFGADLGGPAGRERILYRVEHMQPGAKRLGHPPGEQYRAIECLIEATVYQDLAHALTVRHQAP